ncbi:MAG: ImmA/IrrE family metallo-endopeptidase [Lachnospiraceae bacterium]|nr:ImmA/IrrE family metallo-endopeptidase [Lachnospiraceae bacterium]
MNVYLYLSLFLFICLMVIILSNFITRKVVRDEFNNKIKLDISLEQMQVAEQKIKIFLEENQMQIGESILEIAKILKVKEGGSEEGIAGQARLSEPNVNGEMVVTYKNGLTAEERMFILAHECAHLINNDPVPNARPDGGNKPLVEQVADYTAAALLMPLDSVYNYLKNNNYTKESSKKRVAIVRSLCKIYGVSELIALRRIKEVYELKK